MTRKSTFLCAAMVLLIGAFPGFGQGAQEKEKVLKIAAGVEIYHLDPSAYTGSPDAIISGNWGEFLLNRETSGKITPGLAASWKMSPDGKKMECTLRKGVKFHSGDLMTTKDVEFSYKRGLANRAIKGTLRSVERLEIIDDYRFNFHFKEPDVTFVPNRCGNFPIVSKSYHERAGEETFSKQPSGTGPYKLVSYLPGEYLEIERFEEYWGKKPPVKKARIYFVGEETTRIAKLQAGEVDLIQSVPFIKVKEFENSPDFKVVKLETNHPTQGIVFGHKNPKMPWYDRRVRLAMAYAIDCKAILHNVLNDVPIRLAALAPGELGYDPEVKPYAHDPKKAKALLAEAGYPNGFEIKLNFPTGGRTPMSQEVVQAIAAYFEAVGIRTKLIGQEQAAMLAGRAGSQKPAAEYLAYYTAGFAGSVDPSDSLSKFFVTNGSRTIYGNPATDKLIAEAKRTINDEKRAELIKKAVKIIHEEVATIPMVTSVTNYAMKKDIDFVPTKGINFDYLYVKDMNFK